MTKPTKPLPSVNERPDVYDGYDGRDARKTIHPSNPVEVPERLKKLVARKKNDMRRGKKLMAG